MMSEFHHHHVFDKDGDADVGGYGEIGDSRVQTRHTRSKRSSLFCFFVFN